MKVTITNCWHDDNKGDSGIILGMINNIRQNYPKANLSLVSTFSEDDPRYSNSFRHINKEFPSVSFYGSPIKRADIHTYKNTKSKLFSNTLLRRFWWILHLIRSMFVLILPMSPSNTVNVIKNSDLVISRGGHIFYAKNYLDLYGLLHHLYPLLLAWRVRVPFGIYAQSIGPFRPSISKIIVRFVLSKATFLLVREGISKKELQNCGIQGDRIKVVPDAAFSLLSNPTQRSKSFLSRNELLPGEFVVITPRQWTFSSKNGYKKYVDETVKVIEFIVNHLCLKVVIVSQTCGPIKIEDDRNVANEIYGRIGRNEGIVTLNEDLSPLELIYLYSQSKFIIGTRFHSVIFGLISKTPCIAISYSGPKAYGIMKEFNLDEFVVSISDFREEICVKLIYEILSREKDIKHKINSKLHITREECLNSPRLIMNQLKKV